MATPRSIDRLSPGGRIGPYLLLEPLGSGGSGRVWAVARIGQLGFSKRMVLKVMREDKLGSERARLRFDREARLGASLRHPNLRAVHDLGSHHGRPFMSLSWVDTSLDELLKHAPGHRLEPSVVCWFGIQLCAALAAAHAHVNARGEASAIVHGDVTPGNVLLMQSGHVSLADLAASEEGGSPASAGQGNAGRFFGSVGYASPEALRGEPLDPRADLFSLGCVLYEALCGAPAFEGDDERWVACQVLECDAAELQRRAPGVPDALAAVVQRAMRRAAAERFAGASAMRQALLECVPGCSSFELERRAAALVASVLGQRILEREQRMREVFQHCSAVQLARTDTLPIAQLEQQPPSAGTLISSSSPGLERRGRSERPRSRRPLVALVALGLGLALTVARLRETDPAAPVERAQATVAAALPAEPSVTVATPAKAPLPSSTGEQPSPEPSPRAPPPAARASRAPHASRARPAPPPRAPAAARRPEPPQPQREGDVSRAAPEFTWRLPKNPYARRVAADEATEKAVPAEPAR